MRATASQVMAPADPMRRRPLQPEADDQAPAVAPAAAGAGLPTDVPAPTGPDNPVDALNGIHQHTWDTAFGVRFLALGLSRRNENPLIQDYPIDGSTGVYMAESLPQGEPARSITIYNPQANVPCYVGIPAGIDPTSAAGAIPVSQFLTLPIQADVIKVGFNAADLGNNKATIWVFRWSTVQPFAAL